VYPTRLKVLYIAGWGRSGSTLLDNILGQLDHFASIGEFRYVWDRGLQENHRCGCGALFRDCRFWQEVFREAFGGFDRGPMADMLAIREKYDHTRTVLLRSRMQSHEIECYQSSLVKLYRAVAAVSGATFVVDSSKTPSHGRILQGCRELEVYVVHLVRDSRAVAYSWQRKKPVSDSEYMTRFSAAHSSLLWDGMNAAAEMLRTNSPGGYLRLQYEDLVTAPKTTLESVLHLVGANTEQSPLLHGNKVMLGPVHGFSGNPSRFGRGEVDLRPDDEWRSKLNRAHWFLVTLLTAPLLVRYGYPLTSNRGRSHMRDAGGAVNPAAAD
jgi:hypothetical protein